MKTITIAVYTNAIVPDNRKDRRTLVEEFADFGWDSKMSSIILSRTDKDIIEDIISYHVIPW